MADSNEKHRIINVQQVDNNKPKQKKNEFWKNFDEFVKVNGNSMIGLLQLLRSFAVSSQSFVRV